MSGTTSFREDYLHLDRKTLMKELREFSNEYNKWYGLKVDRETELKLLYAKKYSELKNDVVKRSQKDVEVLILQDREHIEAKARVDEADKHYLSSKLSYNNKNTEISLLQSELKRELQLMGKEK
tara:strand:- start:1137 stop:1508 length:372 start_codon:yes stop_codon:yes gene_type:complete